MAPISSANPPKHVRIPGLLDGNIMVLIYTPDYFESDSVTIMDFADDFLTLNRLHGMVVSRFDIEFYWSFGVRGDFKHDDPQQELLLEQVKSRSFEEYLASLDGTRNGQAFKKELGNKEGWKEQTLAFQLETDAAPNDQEVFDLMDLEASYPVMEPGNRGAPLTESGTKKKKRRRRGRKNKVVTEEPGEAREQADTVLDPKFSALSSVDDDSEDATIASRANWPSTSPAERIHRVNGLEISSIDERPRQRWTFDSLWDGRIGSRPC